MKLSIVTPQFSETESVIKPLLQSIECQAGIEFNALEIIIVNDGSDVLLSRAFLDSFEKLSITYARLTANKGCSVSRNAGLDMASGEYVMFCDADDRFLTCTALLQIMDEIKTEKDFYVFDFIEEAITPIGLQYRQHSANFVFLHGKVYQRKFLTENKIRFHLELRKNVDSFFNGMCRTISADNYKIVTLNVFLWCYNPASMSREADCAFTKFYLLADTSDKLVETLLARGGAPAKFAPLYVAQFCYHTYFHMQSAPWQEKTRAAARCDAEKALAQYYRKYQGLFEQVDTPTRLQFYNQERGKIFLASIESETFDQFLARVCREHNGVHAKGDNNHASPSTVIPAAAQRLRTASQADQPASETSAGRSD